MLRDIIPDMSSDKERITLVILTAKPVDANNVLNIIPRLSPQLTMQRQFTAVIRYILIVLGNPTAILAKTAKIRDVTTVNGSSMTV